MIYLNIIYVLIISWYAFKFLKSDGRAIKSPYGDETYYHFTGPEMFWTLIFSTGVLAFSAPLGIDLMAVRLMIILVLCIMGLGLVKDKPVWSFPLGLYVVYLIWLGIGCFYSPSASYGIRVILKYLYPLVFCLFASAAVSDFTVAIKSSLLARKIAFISVIFSFLPFIKVLIPGVMWYGAARAIHYISIMTFCITLYFFTSEKKKNFWYALVFLAPCFIWVLRTSIMGSGVAIMAFALIRWRLKAVPFILGVLLAGVIAVFTIPSLKEKMFFEQDKVSIESFQKGEVTMDDVNTNTRTVMWEFLEHTLYKDHELVGSGTGAVQDYMYSHYLFGGLTVPHNDFVQMKCDNGAIGMWLYIIFTILIFMHCFKIYWTNPDDRVRLFAITAGASLLGVFATMYSDNTVNYSMATLAMPYGFYGITLGLNKRLVA